MQSRSLAGFGPLSLKTIARGGQPRPATPSRAGLLLSAGRGRTEPPWPPAAAPDGATRALCTHWPAREAWADTEPPTRDRTMTARGGRAAAPDGSSGTSEAQKQPPPAGDRQGGARAARSPERDQAPVCGPVPSRFASTGPWCVSVVRNSASVRRNWLLAGFQSSDGREVSQGCNGGGSQARSPHRAGAIMPPRPAWRWPR